MEVAKALFMGILTGALAYTTYQQARKLRPDYKEQDIIDSYFPPSPALPDVLSVDALAELARSTNARVRRDAWKILLDIAVSDEYLDRLFEMAQSPDEDVRLQALLLIKHFTSFGIYHKQALN